jgi:CrcB protein
MTAIIPWLLVALGGGLGAVARFWLTGAITGSVSRLANRPQVLRLPLGTMSVNILGSFVIGLITGAVLTLGADGHLDTWRLFLATGICGGFTTFSTAMWEAIALARERRVGDAVTTLLGTLVVTVAAVAGGIGLLSVIAR